MTKGRKTPEATPAPAGRREPTARERKAFADADTAQAKRPTRTQIRIQKQGSAVEISSPHSDVPGWGDMMRETFGTSSADFCNILISQIEPVLRDKGQTYISEARANAVLAVMGAIAPADELEASIAGQIIAADALSMDLMMRAKHTDTLEKMQVFTNLATKVSRTMAAHVETLARLRSGGKQQVIVKHVYVQGTAVIGDHAQTLVSGGEGGGPTLISAQPLATVLPGLPIAAGLPLWGEDQARDAMPSAGGQGQAALQDARRQQPGCAEGEGERPIYLREVDAGTGRGSPPGAGRAPRVREA